MNLQEAGEIAKQRGISAQKVIRVVIVPDWLIDHGHLKWPAEISGRTHR
jgi:hypothetical protein